jgi:uncharacterized membrane protein YfcA
MLDFDLVLVCGAVAAIAFLYSSVGHAGASGYIAVLALFGFAPVVLKPTALALNVLVASIASVQFAKAGYLSWRLLWPFALLSIPLAFVGGYLHLPARAFKMLVGVVLLLSAARFLVRPGVDTEPRPPSIPLRLLVGAGLGLLAGLTGTGGGIFLTPLLLLMGWARTKNAAAVSAVFILLNSLAGLSGHLSATREFPPAALALAVMAVLGGSLGSYLGSRRFDVTLVKRLLAAVLTIAGIKLLVS